MRDSERDPAAASREGEARQKLDFIREMVARDVAEGKNGGRVVTRFPPEPNGYLHIGHAKAICLNFGIAEEFGGRCHLRFDDTNPVKEDVEYVEAIQRDIHWLGFDWGENLFFASDYFEQLYGFAIQLIEDGLAYVDSQSADEIRESRGTLTDPGAESPFRGRSADESLDLFRRMRAGEFPNGAHVLRARIDMASPNLNMRDPVLYRILHAAHHRTGDAWPIYPMYDFAHPLSDAIEGVTHSLCSLEFENHRPLYDWCVENVRGLKSRPIQREFARLNLTCTVMSKRKLLQLVNDRHVGGWDDPRMPTLAGLRRRGVTPEAIRTFARVIGLTKFNSMTDVALLENAVREDLNRTALRRMAVLRPIRLTLTNFPAEREDIIEAQNNPEDPGAGTREIAFSRELLIEEDDFMEDAPRKFFRLKPGGEVRLRGAYIVKCHDVARDESGNITEILAECDFDTLGRNPADRKVKGVIHWVSARHALPATVRLYDRLFDVEDPGREANIAAALNASSLETLAACRVEPALADAEPGARFQFERVGYFVADARDHASGSGGALVFNRTVPLRDTWAKVAKRG